MSRLKKKLVALAVVFSVGFLSLGFFANGAFSRAAEHVLSPLNTTSHANLSAIKLASLAKTAGCFVFKEYDELTPRSGNFLAAKETAQFSLRRYTVVPFRFRIILAPRVSRYISKSVLNI